MYEDMDYNDANALSAMLAACEPYLLAALANGSFRGWLAVEQGRIIGGGAVLINPWPSHPYDLECRRATILNVYVHPEYRRKGVARQLMRTMIDWCRKGKLRRRLSARQQERPPALRGNGFQTHDRDAIGFEDESGRLSYEEINEGSLPCTGLSKVNDRQSPALLRVRTQLNRPRSTAPRSCHF